MEMTQFNLNLNIKLSPTPEFIGLVENILGGLKSLSNSNDPAIDLQVQKLPVAETKAIKASPATKAKVEAKIEASKEETKTEITLEQIRSLAMQKSTANPAVKGAIKKMLDDRGVANIPSLSEEAYEEFYIALKAL